MNMPLHSWREWHGKRTTTRFQYPFLFDCMDRFPRIRLPQKGSQNNSSAVSGIPTWVITRIGGSHSDDKARFFESIITRRSGEMERSGSIPFRRILLLSWKGVNFTQVYGFLSETFVKTSWLGQWAKVNGRAAPRPKICSTTIKSILEMSLIYSKEQLSTESSISWCIRPVIFMIFIT